MIVCTRGFVTLWIVAADVHMTPGYCGASAAAELSHVRFKAPNLAGQTTVAGRQVEFGGEWTGRSTVDAAALRI